MRGLLMDRIKSFMHGVARSFVLMPHEAHKSDKDNLLKNWKAVGKYMHYAIGRQTKGIQLKEKKPCKIL